MTHCVIVKDLNYQTAVELCRSYEASFGEKTETFYARYLAGEIEITPQMMEWATAYEIGLELAT